MFLNGDGHHRRPDPRGERIIDDSFLCCSTRHHEPRQVADQPGPWGDRWDRVLDTADGPPPSAGDERGAAGDVELADRSIVVLRRLDEPTRAVTEPEPPS